ncbi:MAG: amidohydrolase [Blautia sp.]|nr:amidohydrolase [Blautia sp.]
MAEKEIFEEIMKRADALAPELVKLRRDFHKYPELGWMEMRTTSIVASCLKEYGCDQVLVGKEVCKAEARMGVPSEALLEDHYEEVKEQEGTVSEYLPYTREGFTGVIGILHCGEGPVVALRFDMDALPVLESSEESHLPVREGFVSCKRGVMHACGHDGHTTVGLGTARILCQLRECLHGTVKFIFQPAEEGVRGARSIVEKGHLDDVDYVLGAHMGGGAQQKVCGIGVGDGQSLATVKLDVEFFGKGSHAAASPEAGNNAMLSMATAILNLHAIPRHGQADTRVNVGKVAAGTGRNIICDSAHMEMEVRGMSEEANEYMKVYAERIISAAAQMHGCTYAIRLMGAARNGRNDEALAEHLAEVCKKQMQLPVFELPKSGTSVSEDYSYMSERVQSHGGQSCYFYNLSCCNNTLHNEAFDFQEEALVNGVKAFCGVTVHLLR